MTANVQPQQSVAEITTTHQLETTDNGVRCVVCHHTWAKSPVHDCPGVVWYEWEEAPEELKTNKQIREAGQRLKKDAVAAGCLWSSRHGWIWLYDVAKSTEPRPPLTPGQIAGVERMRERARERRTCVRCGVEQESRRYLTVGLCDNCIRKEQLSADRERAIKWARYMLANPAGWVILDTETTGLDHDAEIIQVAIVSPNGAVQLDSYCKPVGPIPADATYIHGITDEMVKDAPDFPTVYEKIAALLNGKKTVIYNAEFDRSMLRQTCRRHGIEILSSTEWLCAMERYAEFYGEWSDYWHSYKWQPLPGGNHTAVGDCLATLKLIEEMANTNLTNLLLSE